MSPSAVRAGSARLRAPRWHDPVTRHTLVGLIGSVLLGVGALGVGYLPPRSRLGGDGLTDILRTTSVGRGFSHLLVIVGVIVLLRAWFQFGADVRAARIAGTERLTRVFWLWAVPLMVTPPLFSQDVYSYTAQGNLLNVGYDPYEFGPAAIPGARLEAVSSVWLDTPAPYGPLFLYAGKITADLLGNHIYLAALVMRLLALVGVYLIARYLPRLARACGVDPALALWAGLLNPLVLMHFVSGAHNDALMLGLVIAALALALEGRPLVAAVAVALAGTVKAPALLVLGFVGLAWAIQRSGMPPRLRSRFLPWLGVALAALATFLVVNALTGLDFGWVSALNTPGMVKTWISPTTALALSLGFAGSALGLGDHSDSILSAIRGAAMAGVLLLISWWLLRPRAIAPGLGAAVALLLVAVFGPVIQPWYLLWGIVAIAGAGLTRRGVPYLTALTTSLVTYCLLQSSATATPFVRVPDWIGSAVTIAVGVAILAQNPTTRAEIAAFLFRLRRPWRRDRGGPDGPDGSGDATAPGELSPVRT